MKYLLKDLFYIIDEQKTKEEFYYETAKGGYGVNSYLNEITNFNPYEYVIVEADGSNFNINETKNLSIGECEIEVSGILIYDFVPHIPSFQIVHLKNIKEALNFMYGDSGISNCFTGDIIIIEDGKRKKYYVEDKNGKLLNYNDIAYNYKKIEFNIIWYYSKYFI